MKPVFLTLLALTTAVVADKTCTPSFDYCANSLIKDKDYWTALTKTGFTEEDVKSALKDTDFKDEKLDNILLHCKNPGIVGHAKLCKSGCKESKQEGSHSC